MCITASGRAPALVSKFRPPVPVAVVTPDVHLVRHCRCVGTLARLGARETGRKLEGASRLVSKAARVAAHLEQTPVNQPAMHA